MGQCDCCGRNVQDEEMFRLSADASTAGIDTYACAECVGAEEDEDEPSEESIAEQLDEEIAQRCAGELHKFNAAVFSSRERPDNSPVDAEKAGEEEPPQWLAGSGGIDCSEFAAELLRRSEEMRRAVQCELDRITYGPQTDEDKRAADAVSRYLQTCIEGGRGIEHLDLKPPAREPMVTAWNPDDLMNLLCADEDTPR